MRGHLYHRERFQSSLPLALVPDVALGVRLFLAFGICSPEADVFEGDFLVVSEGYLGIGRVGEGLGDVSGDGDEVVGLKVVEFLIVLFDFFEAKRRLIVIHKLLNLPPIAVAPLLKGANQYKFVH